MQKTCTKQGQSKQDVLLFFTLNQNKKSANATTQQVLLNTGLHRISMNTGLHRISKGWPLCGIQTVRILICPDIKWHPKFGLLILIWDTFVLVFKWHLNTRPKMSKIRTRSPNFEWLTRFEFSKLTLSKKSKFRFWAFGQYFKYSNHLNTGLVVQTISFGLRPNH